MTTPYQMPGFGQDAFNCPHCGAYAHQNWANLLQDGYYTEIRIATCERCREGTIWYKEKQLWPRIAAGPLPSKDLGDEIIALYNEARDVASLSPRSAAALLRLCTEMLVQHLCRESSINYRDLNQGIGELVQLGLPVQMQQALDTLRVVGNDAVHPGQINFDDDSETVMSLFGFLNLIANDRITQPREIENLYSKLPAQKLQGIEDRDN